MSTKLLNRKLSENNTDYVAPKVLPAVDLIESKDSYVLLVELPGVKPTDVDMSLEKNVLTITGTAHRKAPEGYKAVTGERGSVDYQRSFRLSDQIDQEAIEATFENGILRLTLGKSQPAKAKKIEIQFRKD